MARLTRLPRGPGSWSGAGAGENAEVSQTRASATPESAALFERARAVTPGGVNSPVRAFNAVGGTPRFIERAQGPYLFDADGNEYVDLVGSWGPMLLGHAHPQVVDAVRAAVERGTSYGTPTRPEVELAEAIVARTPVERVRLVSSGTEATMSAMRLARGFTGREIVVKFAGCYHGHVDSLLAQAGSGLATLAVPRHAGCPGRGDRRDHRAALQRPRRGGAGVRRARRRDRLRHHRGGAGQHGRRPAGARLQQAAVADLCQPRRAVHQRRGDDRLPRQPLRSPRRSTAPSRAGCPT